MAKVQELTDLFPKYDTDGDGEIDQEQFSNLITEMGLPYQYPGSVNKIFRKLNYSNPEKNTINLHQAIQYYSSFQTPSKHDIWKAKYTLLQNAHQIKAKLKQTNNDSAAPAAPGAQPHLQSYEESPQDAKVNILIGQPKPNYLSEIEIEVEKTEKSSKVKPFIKLVLTSSTPQRAKQIETVFKQNFSTFLNLLAQDISDWTEQMKNFHINSMVQGTTTTFFFTTANQELVSLIQLFSQQFEVIFNTQLECKAHLKFEFQYDFQDFLKKPNSNFYDIFVKQSRLSFTGKTFRLMKQLKGYLKLQGQLFPNDLIQRLIPFGLLHLEEFGVDLQFDSFGNDQEYELQSKQELSEALNEAAGFLLKLNSGGMTIKTLLELLDGSIYLQADVGQWRIKNYFRLTNLNKIFLNALEKNDQNSDENLYEQNAKQLGPTSMTVDQVSSVKSGNAKGPQHLQHSAKSSSQSEQSVQDLKYQPVNLQAKGKDKLTQKEP